MYLILYPPSFIFLFFLCPQARVITESVPPFRITHVNDAWEGLCGFTRQEAVGKTLGMLQGPGTIYHTDTHTQPLKKLTNTHSYIQHVCLYHPPTHTHSRHFRFHRFADISFECIVAFL